MCGINGIISRKSLDKIADLINGMNNNILHRGPDEGGAYIYENKLALGMRRLSIIDLHSGTQPIFNDDKSICIVFNGEIYNYLVLKDQLLQENVSFHTKSDTEVVLKLYERYGTSAVEYLNGMFAFAIFDSRHQTVFIARDRVGEKPLYYYYDADLFVWGSELKSIVNNFRLDKKISKEALNLYFSLTFIPSPYTIYESIFKLEAGNYLVIDINNLSFKKQQYWDVQQKQEEMFTDYEEAKSRVKGTVYESIEQRMLADVPLGSFLSGGVDSSIVSAVMSDISPTQIQTFSIGFEDKHYDESKVASYVAKHLKTAHTELILQHGELMDEMDHVLENFDEPFADSSAIPTYFVSKLTRKSVKVALTGDGGDEVFGGYNRYLINNYYRKYKRLVPNTVHNNILKPLINTLRETNTRSRSYRIRKLINSFGANELENIQHIISLGFQKQEKADLLQVHLLNDELENRISREAAYLDTGSILKIARYVDKNISLEGDMLTKVDRTSMLNSIECRAPLLDYRLFELTNRMPDSYLIHGKSKKRILKETFAHLLPPDLFTLPKKGFEIPIGGWLRNELKEKLITYLSAPVLEKQGLFKPGYVQHLLKEHFENRKDYSFKLWTLYCFQHWYFKNIQSL